MTDQIRKQITNYRVMLYNRLTKLKKRFTKWQELIDSMARTHGHYDRETETESMKKWQDDENGIRKELTWADLTEKDLLRGIQKLKEKLRLRKKPATPHSTLRTWPYPQSDTAVEQLRALRSAFGKVPPAMTSELQFWLHTESYKAAVQFRAVQSAVRNAHDMASPAIVHDNRSTRYVDWLSCISGTQQR
uniref:Reverse transcriptase n=1 Tax=Panagrellus redivivus TaxID=6233 RepID=A0A7E4VHR0_PANRE